MRLIVLWGLVVRAVTGTLLFWISWLGLPILTPLQMGNGHWFFAADGRGYLHKAIGAAQEGLPAILMLDRTQASVSHVQTLALFALLFGSVASVALLISAFCYLGMCLLIVKFGAAVPQSRTAVLVALAAITLSPSGILWATQPLKDPLFQFLIVCLIVAGGLWQQAWRGSPASRQAVGAALLMIGALFLAAGMRWYFALFAVVAAGGLFLLTAVTAGHRWKAGLAGVAVAFLLGQALVISASGYLPPHFRKVLAPWTPVPLEGLAPTSIAADLNKARRGFESTGGATSIGVAGPLARIDEGRRFVPRHAPVTSEDRARVAALRSSEAPESSGGAITMPTSTLGRLVTGGVAMILPNSLAKSLGLLEIGGGRGLSWFADADSVLFDLVLVIAIVFIVRRVRWATLRNPIFWYVVALMTISLPIAYTVTNYGTLFRLRGMLFVMLALVPLALSAATAQIVRAPRVEGSDAGGE